MNQRATTRGRDVHGILLFDKPAGLSSNQALQRVRRLYAARKAGHTGNLDPLATGLLPICFGEATKITPYLLDAGKRYRALIRLGRRTSTGDLEGETIATAPVGPLTAGAVEEVLRRFLGPIEQVPPMHSALKHRGEPLYRLAARGVEIERQPRRVTIHELLLHDLGADALDIEVACSKGTYIRTLAEDIGIALGTCAHLANLRRLAVEQFRVDDAHALPELEEMAVTGTVGLDDLLLPIDAALAAMPAVTLTAATARYFAHGQAVHVNDLPVGVLRVYDPQRFLGLGEALGDGRLAPRRLLNLG